MTEIIGWAASFLLLATLVKQVYKQWKEESNDGVSSWLFLGQLLTSIGFTVYSYLVGNWVFLFTNGLLILNNLVGVYIYYRNSRSDHSPKTS